MTQCCVRHWWLFALPMLVCLRTQALAQDVQPRVFSPAPVGTNVIGLAYSYSTGAVLFDKSIPIEDAEGNIHSVALAFSRSMGILGMSGRFDVVLPMVTGQWKGVVSREEGSTGRTGVGDPSIRIGLFFLGAPALSPQEFAEYRNRKRTVLGVIVRVGIPVGQYDPEAVVNLGSNRWQVSPQLGFSHISGRLLVEAYASTWLFSTNSSFLGAQSQKQDPIFTFQVHLGYRFKLGLWAAVSSRQSVGGAVSIDGGEKLEPETNNRIGLAVGVPVGTRNTLRFALTTPLRTTVGNDYDTFAIALQTVF